MTHNVAFANTLVVSPSDVPAELASELAGRYQLERRLGEGGMGVVYQARHAILGRPVALKVIRRQVAADPQTMERLRREAQSASQIDSPHVVKVLDFDTLRDGSGFVVMELLEGRALADEIQASGPFPIERALHVARQLCDALGAAHDRGIVHRDLKPENVVLVERDGAADFAKIVDFGLAKVEGAKALTVAGRAIGTPHFMSPEQCAGDSVDSRTDVYSLGCVLFEMLTGRLPFEGMSLSALLLAHLTMAPPSPRSLRADLPPALEAVVLRCLEKDRSARFASMRALRAALDEAAAVASGASTGGRLERWSPAAPLHGIPATPTAWPSPRPAAPKRRSTSPLASLAGAAFVLLLACGIGVGVFSVVRSAVYAHRAHAHVTERPALASHVDGPSAARQTLLAYGLGR